MQNILKHLFGRISSYFEFSPFKLYIFDHSISKLIDMHILKLFLKNLIFVGVRKKSLRGEGQKVMDMSATISFFDAFPYVSCVLFWVHNNVCWTSFNMYDYNFGILLFWHHMMSTSWELGVYLHIMVLLLVWHSLCLLFNFKLCFISLSLWKIN